MIRTEWDELTQRECIVQNVHKNENAFVEAGAGAGKTTLIVSRIIEQLKKGDSPESIVVITFTNAAAEELRSRIISKVRESCKEEQDFQKRFNLEKALESLDGMNISTIHSFCFRLLKERLFDAKLPMDVQLLEEAEATAMKERFFQDFIRNFTDSDWKLLEQYEFWRGEAVGYIRDIFMNICELTEDTEIKYDKAAVGQSCTSSMKNLVEDFTALFCQSAAALLGKQSVTLSQIPAEMLIKREKNNKSLIQLLSEKEIPYLKTLKLIYEKKGKHQYFKKARFLTTQVSLEAEDQKCADWVHDNTKVPSVEAVIKLQEKYRYMTLVDYAVKARKAYREGRALRYLTNDDLLQKTHYLLCKSEYAKDAREYFAGKYRCFYVDEFQDTDSIQEEFIWRLAADLEDDTKLRPGSLFLVGDPKQSIYRFRGAEPEVYFKAKEKMAHLDNAGVYYLGYNFRSNEEIISWVNTRFSGKKISAEPYRAMTAMQKSAKQAGIKLLAGVYQRGVQDKNDTKIVSDARNVAELIKELHDKEYLITEYKEGRAEPRKITYSDFLLLCLNKKDMDLYLDALRKEGIPTLINGSVSLAENMVLNIYARLFDYLTHPYVGIHPNSDEKRVGALEALRRAGHRDAEALLDRVKEAVHPAEGYSMSPHGIADYLLHRLELLLPVDEEIKAWELHSVQTKLEQMYEKILSRPCRNAEELSACFWDYINTTLERELPLEEAGNAVRFMNIHKAKGLEGNIVILLKRDGKVTFSEGNLRKGKEYYPAVRSSHNIPLWSAYRYLPTVKTYAEEQEAQEQTRLAYVAATRAKQVLIFMPALTDYCMFYDYDLQNNATDLLSVINKCRQNEPGNTESELGEIIYEAYEAEEYIKVKDIPKQPYIKKSPSSFEKASETRRKAWEERKENYKPDTSRPTGNVFGTVLHRSLQLLIERWGEDFNQKPEGLVHIMEASAAQAMMENRINIPAEEIRIYRNYLSEILHNFADRVYNEQLFIHAQKVYTEIPFSFYDKSYTLAGEEEEQKVWMNGTADLIVVDKEENYHILDYKSDHDGYLTEEEFNKSVDEMYGAQLNQYKNAVQRLFGVSSDKIKLTIISFNRERQVRFTEIKK